MHDLLYFDQDDVILFFTSYVFLYEKLENHFVLYSIQNIKIVTDTWYSSL